MSYVDLQIFWWSLVIVPDNYSGLVVIVIVTCIIAGLSRMERWRRAKKFGFNPPSQVHDLVIAHSDDDSYTQW